MNQLPEKTRTQILNALLEGLSVRATARITGTSKGSVLRLIREIGPTCEAFLDRFVRNVEVSDLQLDEVWQYVMAHDRAIPPEERHIVGIGSTWCWTAIESTSKLLISYVIGGRDAGTCLRFARDLASRVVGEFQMTSDGYRAYPPAIREAFRFARMHYGVVDKLYGPSANESGKSAAARYSPGRLRGIEKKVISGDPDVDKISTSYMERWNLTIRQSSKRYQRLGLGYSKDFQHHCWAVAMHVFFYDFVRKHMTIKKTPAQAAGLTEYRFTTRDMLHLGMWMTD
jgi:IS1 family transposase